MSFLGNDAINRVNVHTTIQAMAQGAGGVFVFVYLLKAGVSAPFVLCTIAGMTAGRFVLRPLVLVVARRRRLRATLIIGTILEAAIFLLLPSVHGSGGTLALIIAVGALGSVFYWTSLHACYALLGDAEHRGQQIGVRVAAAALMNIAAPWLGGWALGATGPVLTFGLVAVVQVAAIAPLLGLAVPRVADVGRSDWRGVRLAVVLQAADGWFGAGFYNVWQIALFVTLGEHFASYGGAMALAGLAGAGGSLVVGRLIDLGHARVWVFVAYGACAFDVVLKAASLHDPALAGPRQRPGHRRGPAARAGDDDARLQPGQGLALPPALPHGYRGRLGRRLLRGLPHRRGPGRRPRLALGRHPSGAGGGLGGSLVAAAQLQRASAERVREQIAALPGLARGYRARDKVKFSTSLYRFSYYLLGPIGDLFN
ncbi:MAG: hypothetical protein JWO83_733 [Caulobacteraceae bacterium]|nr:hypothetical protein [Caulobacteraceae bacterium]